ncbi:DUF3422 domain-containing protein [Asticcacaulis sp. AC466]|uniref:DUF3422 domain-containing protein n=1 Tax=Asticcacaulis sp. AC466 TaxID=1282362 RepID=UPI0004136E62|nr:DUF3422 domain-containing protein [Asticcacaulis sp. AC466]
MTSPNDHDLRRSLSDLMHERTLPIYRTPVAVRSWVYLVTEAERAAESAWIDHLDPGAGDRSRLARIGDTGGAIWERHGEFSTWLKYDTDISLSADVKKTLGFGKIRMAEFDWLDAAPGWVFRSVEISVLPYEPKDAQLQTVIDLTQAVCCDVFDGAARIWSDFRMHAKEDKPGAGRIYVHDKGLENDEASRLLQTLLEIGHYRKLALLGFPVARELMTWLKGAEDRLAALTSDMASQSASQEELLERLMALSAEVEQRVNAVRFRQGATEAYARLTADRLVSLRESRVAGFSTMQEFIERRLQPAMRTCEAASRRLDDISARIGRVSDLLRARISISLEVQNQGLLKSMNVRSKLQMKLSALVEGLSVFAVSYYIFSLVKYIIDPLVDPHLSHLLYGPIILVILTAAWLFITHRKKSIGHGED